MTLKTVFYSVLILLGVCVAGCIQEAVRETGLPEGWQGDAVRWWHSGADTVGVFRDLETLAAMNVSGSEVTYVASSQMADQRASQRQWFERAVKQSLIRLYRNHPEVVDSLFERHVAPMLQEVTLSGNPQEEVQTFKQKGYAFLHRNYFQAPQTALQIGRDIEVPYPDELRKRQVAGTVRTQAYLNAEGEPLAVELLEGVDSELDAIAMRAVTQMRWRPAYLMRKGRWVPIAAWVRFTVKFGEA